MITVVIPTVGRPSLRVTLAALGPDVPVVVVDDRPAAHAATGQAPLEVPGNVRVVRSGGRGPAAARNAGWRTCGTPWVAFLDDDVVPEPGWAAAVRKDLVGLADDVAGSQGRIVVPLPRERRPTDAERNTAGLTRAEWPTADMAYRRTALERVGGFDERFPRAYREDADLALRMFEAGFRLVKGTRVTVHPVRDDGFWSSVRFQRGNADDARMRRRYGPGWREAIGGGPRRLRTHALTTALGLTAAACAACAAAGVLAVRHRATSPRAASRTPAASRGAVRAALPLAGVAAAAGWAALTAEFAWARVSPGPRTSQEVLRMVVTSVVIPPVACAHRLRGEWEVRR
ncbi:glycosyltransferase family 2 protein [Nonomuraea sp. LPB2021202275-12-8]|uniref:glycosyltransferase family 2 protein n=1 Tax=Nonomuraea sp. LPB2021202275-12-8 TaxID=3120159 RepID=UPI00300CC87D